MARFLGRATFCEGVAGINLTLSRQEVQDQIGNDSTAGATELTARKLANLRVSATPLSSFASVASISVILVRHFAD